MPVDSPQKTVAWLHHFGYLDTEHPTVYEFDEAILSMQRVYGLVEDSIAGPVTRRAMGLFRCAHGDHALRQGMRVDKDHCRWEKDEITYSIGSKFRLAGQVKAGKDIIREGFKLYEGLTGKTFTEIRDWHEADIRVGRGRGRKWDFDGPGNVLAWAELPCRAGDQQLLSMFDDTEPWNLREAGPGVIMKAVWLHELGHLMGLDHSDDPSDLMAPYYNPQVITPQEGDRARLARVYGLETDEPTPEPEPSPDASETSAPILPEGPFSVIVTVTINQDGMELTLKPS